MAKIMFVEDEISSNIPRLQKLFESYLSAEENEKLSEAENNPMGANGEDIRNILSQNPVLEVHDSFKEVLMRILDLKNDELKDYDMFIFDRNLTGGLGYSSQEIQQIDPGFDPFHYSEREGDYLALQLLLKGCPLDKKVFFYSAYSSRGLATPLEQMVEKHGTFFKENFFDKGLPDRLIELINNRPRASVYAKYREIFGIISNNNLGISDEMMDILLEAQKEDGKLSTKWRLVIKACLEHMSENSKLWRDPPCKNDSLGDMIKKLDRGDEKMEVPGRTPGHIRDFIGNINHIINHYAAHKIYENPSHYAVKALAYQLLEIIAWIGSGYTIGQGINNP